MDDFASKIEALEHRFMRAWISGERGEMKTLAARDFVVLFGAERPAILDRASWLSATEQRLRCSKYRFGSVYVRRHGKVAIFTAPVELEMRIDREVVLDKALMTTIWHRSAVRRRWHMVERVFGGLVEVPDIHAAIRSMQLWR